MNIIENGLLSIPLYHGTSSLFLDSIIDHGLAGRNPIADWKILEIAKEVLNLSEIHLSDFETFVIREVSFRKMVDQKITKGGMNFQHGDTYISPSERTAIQYAIDKQYGSELLTYTIDLLRELERRDVPGVRTTLYKKYHHIFSLLDISPAPILVKLTKVPVTNLLSEFGEDASDNLEMIETNFRDHPKFANELNQQNNFRLKIPIITDQLQFWLINVKSYSQWKPEYTLYKINR